MYFAVHAVGALNNTREFFKAEIQGRCLSAHSLQVPEVGRQFRM